MHLPSAERWRGGWESYGSRDTDSYSSYQDATDILEWSFLLLCTSSGQCLRLKIFFGDFLSNNSCLAGWLSAGLLTLPSWMCISVLACFWLRSGYCWVLLGGGMALPWLLECKCGLLKCACMPTWKGIDCGHFVLSAGPGWAAFLRSLFLTCVWLGWATWEILLRYLESQNVATAILHTCLSDDSFGCSMATTRPATVPSFSGALIHFSGSSVRGEDATSPSSCSSGNFKATRHQFLSGPRGSACVYGSNVFLLFLPDFQLQHQT